MTDLKQWIRSNRPRRMFRRIVAPDMTPMAGVGFLLVSFFMLTTTFVRPTLMELAMPVKPTCMLDGSICISNNALTVLLGKNNQVYYYPGLDTDVVRKTDFSPAGLRKILQSYQSEYGLVVLLKPSDGATYKNMVDALDELQITNTKRYALVDLNHKDEELLRNNHL